MSAMRAAGTRTRAVAVRCAGVTKTYGEGRTAVHALRGVDLTVGRGEFVVVLGPSGSGKTTLLNVCGAIEQPTSGQIVVDGRHLGALDDAERTAFRREHVGFVFQFFNLIPTLTARENVELVAELTGGEPARRAEEALRAVELGDRLDHFPSQLSGGEQQRVAIARALAKEPALLLCDEPTGALDVEAGRHVLAILRELNRAHDRTVVCVTHNSEIGRLADRVVKMHSGEVERVRTVAEPVPAQELRW